MELDGVVSLCTVTFSALLLWIMLMGQGGYPMLDETRMHAGYVLFLLDTVLNRCCVGCGHA